MEKSESKTMFKEFERAGIHAAVFTVMQENKTLSKHDPNSVAKIGMYLHRYLDAETEGSRDEIADLLPNMTPSKESNVLCDPDAAQLRWAL